MDRDLPEQNLRRGDTALTYAYRGEGFSAVGLNDRHFSYLGISFAKWADGTGCGGEHCAATHMDLGRKSWWAEMKLNSGRDSRSILLQLANSTSPRTCFASSRPKEKSPAPCLFKTESPACERFCSQRSRRLPVVRSTIDRITYTPRARRSGMG